MYKKLAPTTEANYRVRLRKLRKVRPLLTDQKQIALCDAEMLRLADKLGMEVEDPKLDVGPGRPSIRMALTEELMERVPKETYDRSLKASIEKMEQSEKDLRELEIVAKRTGMTKEEVEERNRKMNEDAQKNKTVQDKRDIFNQALDNAIARAIREKGKALTDQERALVEVRIQDEFTQQAEEDRLKEVKGDKGHPTGS